MKQLLMGTSRFSFGTLLVVGAIFFSGCLAPYQMNYQLPEVVRSAINRQYARQPIPRFQFDDTSKTVIITTGPDSFWGSGNRGQFPLGQAFHSLLEQVSMGNQNACKAQVQTIHARIVKSDLHYKYARASWLVPDDVIKIGWVEITLETENQLDGSGETYSLTTKGSYDTPLLDVLAGVDREEPVGIAMMDLTLNYLQAITDHFKAQLPTC